MALQGKLIKWLKPERNYINPVNGIDYSIINSNPCPVIPGNPIIGLPDGEEWLANYTVPSSPYDQRIWEQIVILRPTNIAHPTYAVYNQYQTSFTLKKRSEAEIIASINAKLNDANTALSNEAGGAVFMANVNTILTNKSNGQVQNEDQQKCLDLLVEMTVKMNNNAEHANNLIAVVKAGGEPDFDSVKSEGSEFGWEYDRLTLCKFPIK